MDRFCEPLPQDEEIRHDHRRWIRTLFDETAGDYERIEWVVGFGAGRWYRRNGLRRGGLRPGMRVLDVGLGTGLLAREAVRIVGNPALVVGVDPSLGMLKAAQVPAGSHRIIGCVEQLPLATGIFEFVCMGYVLRYLPRMEDAFAEIHRVLRPGGQICILEISRPHGLLVRAAWAAHIRGVLPVLTRLLGRAHDAPRLVDHLWDTIERSPKPDSVSRALENCGYTCVQHQLDLGIFSAYLAKKPDR